MYFPIKIFNEFAVLCFLHKLKLSKLANVNSYLVGVLLVVYFLAYIEFQE